MTEDRKADLRGKKKRRGLLWLGGISLAAVGGGLGYGWFFLHHQLTPLIQKELSNYLNRPINVGDFQGISGDGVLFGATEIPRTGTDRDQVTAEGVRVELDAWKLMTQRRLELDVTLINPNVYVEQDERRSWLSLKLGSGKPAKNPVLKVALKSLYLQRGMVTLVARDKNNQLHPPFKTILSNGVANFLPDNQITFNLIGNPVNGGNLGLNGQIQTTTTAIDLDIVTKEIQTQDVTHLVNLPVDLEAGKADVDLKIQLRRDQTPRLYGRVIANQVTGIIPALTQPLTNTNGAIAFDGYQINFENLSSFYGSIPATLQGGINIEGDFNLKVKTESVDLTQVIAALKLPPPPIEISGAIKTDIAITGPVNKPQTNFEVVNTGVTKIDRVKFQSLKANLDLIGTTVAVKRFEALPELGGTTWGWGTINLPTASREGDLAFVVQGDRLPGKSLLSLYNPKLPPNVGQGFIKLELWAPLNNLSEVRATGNANLNVAGGVVSAANISLTQQRWNSDLRLNNLALPQFAPDLRGNLNGNLQVTGNINNLSLGGIQAKGNVNLSEGISVIRDGIRGQINWNGKRLFIVEAIAPKITISGFMDIREGIDNLQLAVKTKSLPLQSLALPSITHPLKATVDFNGKITGKPQTPTIEGNLTVGNLVYCVTDGCGVADRFEFERFMTGKLQITPTQPFNLQLAGVNDKVELTLDEKYLPKGFLVRFNEATAIGRRQQQTLNVKANNLPIELLTKAVSNENTLPLGGNLFGDVIINMTNLAAQGKVAIYSPLIGRFRANSLTADVEYLGGKLNLSNGQLEQGESKYLFEGNFKLGNKNPEFEAKINIIQGDIQDILASLQFFKFADFAQGFNEAKYSTITELYQNTNKQVGEPLFSIGVREPNLEKQLKILSTLPREMPNNHNLVIGGQITDLPELEALKGKIQGDINIKSTQGSGLGLNFNISGQQWEWGTYGLDELIARGSYELGILKLFPIQLKDGERSLTFSGGYGDGNQSLKLELVKIPLELLKNFINLPGGINFSGKINADVDIIGKPHNPQAFGKLALIDTKINQTLLNSTQAQFEYKNARLDFKLSSFLTNNLIEPLRVRGSIPYQLPFAKIKPNNYQADVTFSLKNEGFILLDILSKNNLKWLGGDGSLNGQLLGTLNPQEGGWQLKQIQGGAIINQGEIAMSALPNSSFTGMKGKISLSGNDLIIANLSSKFSGGHVNINGVIPVTGNNQTDKTLNINLENLSLNLPDQYIGKAQGNIFLTNSLSAPSVAGEINLSNGQIFIPGGNNNDDNNQSLLPIGLNNFRVNLQEEVQIIKTPILNFIAKGGLTLKGNLNNLLPEGTIKLERGLINLFTSQLRLASDYDNTARFTVNRLFDPLLNVKLVGSVIETYPRGILRDPNSGEINDITRSQLGTIQTIRIQARVNGYASQLNQNLELTSSPPRAKRQIIALLGGGFGDTLQQDQTVITLANIAGSALFGTFQGTVADALGLSELQIFPTPILQPKQRDTVFGLAIEAGIDLGDRFTLSILKILTTEQPPQYGIRYRLNERTVIRGSTDFSTDSRGIIEYEQRF